MTKLNPVRSCRRPHDANPRPPLRHAAAGGDGDRRRPDRHNRAGSRRAGTAAGRAGAGRFADQRLRRHRVQRSAADDRQSAAGGPVAGCLRRDGLSGDAHDRQPRAFWRTAWRRLPRPFANCPKWPRGFPAFTWRGRSFAPTTAPAALIRGSTSARPTGTNSAGCRTRPKAGSSCITISPEYASSPDVIRRVAESGVLVAIGHTQATGEQIQAAVEAGARMSTHLGNGAHPMIRRHPNYIWDQLAEDRLVASLIVDGHHLPPAVVKSMIRAKTPARVVLVSDITSMGGMPPGKYQTGLGELEVLPGGKLVPAGRPGILAGASLPIHVCVANVMRFAGVDLTNGDRDGQPGAGKADRARPSGAGSRCAGQFVLVRFAGQRRSAAAGARSGGRHSGRPKGNRRTRCSLCPSRIISSAFASAICGCILLTGAALDAAWLMGLRRPRLLAESIGKSAARWTLGLVGIGLIVLGGDHRQRLARRLVVARSAAGFSRRPHAAEIRCSGRSAAAGIWQNADPLATSGRVEIETHGRRRSRASRRSCGTGSCSHHRPGSF